MSSPETAWAEPSGGNWPSTSWNQSGLSEGCLSLGFLRFSSAFHRAIGVGAEPGFLLGLEKSRREAQTTMKRMGIP
jgi:hypothetical protein